MEQEPVEVALPAEHPLPASAPLPTASQPRASLARMPANQVVPLACAAAGTAGLALVGLVGGLLGRRNRQARRRRQQKADEAEAKKAVAAAKLQDTPKARGPQAVDSALDFTPFGSPVGGTPVRLTDKEPVAQPREDDDR
jgi:hypothetical protein